MGFFLYIIIFFLFHPIAGLWSTQNHEIVFNATTPMQIIGVNWFGFETLCHTLHGLWVHPLNHYMDLFHDHGINSIRIPLSYEVISELESSFAYPPCVSEEVRFQDKNVRDMLHIIFYETQQRGITILLDFHTIYNSITEFPWIDTVSEESVLETWMRVISQYKQYSNLIGIDIKNEPHGAIDWTVWGSYVQRFIARVRAEHPDYGGLFFVEGIQDALDGSAWGGSFSSMGNSLGDIPDGQIVFSPHVYGISVRGSYASADSPFQWDTWFGHLTSLYNNPIVIGELGGLDFGDDLTWHANIRDYLIESDIRNVYYWTLNPNSIDTGGLLLMDWTTPNYHKFAFLQSLKKNKHYVHF